MRVVKLTWNQKVNVDANYSLQVESLIDDDAPDSEADALGANMGRFVNAFQEGLLRQAAEL